MTHLTVIILTYNETEHIRDCIKSVAFADAVLVFDSFSNDGTQAIARDMGATVIEHPFENYSQQRNSALTAMHDKTDWVLFIDADERVSPELAVEIRHAIDDPGNVAGWQIPRHNYIFGKLTRATGWYPDYQTRLLLSGAAHYDPEKIVHEVVQLQGDLGTLINPLIHFNYRDISQFAAKQRRYSQFDAEILYKQGENIKPWSIITMPLHHFRWRFFTLKGYTDGWHGFLLSFLMARYEFRKYWLLGGLYKRGTPD